MALASFTRAARVRVRSLPRRHGGMVVISFVAAAVALGFGLRLERAIDPPTNPGGSSVVAYQGNDTLAYEQIAAALYENGRYGTPQMRSPSDWSPAAPLVYAGD